MGGLEGEGNGHRATGRAHSLVQDDLRCAERGLIGDALDDHVPLLPLAENVVVDCSAAHEEAVRPGLLVDALEAAGLRVLLQTRDVSWRRPLVELPGAAGRGEVTRIFGFRE